MKSIVKNGLLAILLILVLIGVGMGIRGVCQAGFQLQERLSSSEEDVIHLQKYNNRLIEDVRIWTHLVEMSRDPNLIYEPEQDVYMPRSWIDDPKDTEINRLQDELRKANERKVEEPNVVEDVKLILSEVVEGVIGGVVHISCPQWQGSGFVVGPRLIETARHVVAGQTDFTITTIDGHVIKATRAISHKNSDFGYIYIDDLTCVAEAAEDISCRKGGHEVELQVLKLGNFSDCKLGEDVFAIGGSLGKQHFPNLTSGIISNLNLDLESFGCPEMKGWSVMWMTDAATYGGNSGCPVFNMDGEVIGVLVGGFQDYESTSYCIPMDVSANNTDLIELMFVQDKYQFEGILDNRITNMQIHIVNLQQQVSYLQQDNRDLWDMYEWFLENRESFKEVLVGVESLRLVVGDLEKMVESMIW